MADRAQVSETIRGILLARWPGRFHMNELTDDVSLGEQGLGLDSIEVVEILFACEEQCEGLSTEELLASGPVAVGQLIDHFAGA
jgi:acyl carrier protein